MSETNRRAALLVATLASFLFPFMGGAAHVAVPAIGAEFRADAATLNWIVTAFIVVSAMGALPFGRLADIVGRKRTFLIGTAVLGLGTLLCVPAFSLPMLIAARAVQGVGAGLLAGTAPAILVSIFPPRERGRVLGIQTAAVYAGLAAGPVFGGLLTHWFGWRSVFLFSLVVTELTWLTARTRLVGEWAEARGERYDVAGAVLSATSVGLLTVGITLLRSWVAAPWLAAGGVVTLALFLWHESRTVQPILEVGLLRRNRMFALSNLAALISYAATFAATYLLSLYLQVARGLSAQAAGGLMLAGPVVQAALSPWAGRLSDRVAPRVVASVGMAVCAVALGGLALVGGTTPLPLVIGVTMTLGAGFALFSSPNTNAVMSSVERRTFGVAAATLGTARQIGMTLSMALVTVVLTLHLGTAPVTPEVAGPLVEAMRVAFAIFAVLCLAGVPASLARGRANR
ncbi:MAG: MFS transporter [Deltaproteobacteria bacterium]|nr:MFS transporter [Deltaproteobacteria bacterium]